MHKSELPVTCIIFNFLILFCNAIYANEFIVAVRAKNGIDFAYKQWQPTVNYLQNKSLDKSRFILLPIVDLDDIYRQAEKSEFDFLITNPSSFIKIKEKIYAKALATLNNKQSNTGQSRFGSVIFTHVRNEDIISLNDIKGKRLMAVSESAFCGWQAAWLEFIENDINPYHDFGSLLFADGIQQSVVYAVRDGIADVGVVRTGQLESMEKSGEIDMRYFRILNNKEIKDFPFFLSTKLYPEWVFSALNKVPEQQIQHVKKILLSIPENSRAAQAGGYMGWIPPKDYLPVYKLMKKLKVESHVNN